MRYGSVCSGIEAATAAWHGLGWRPAYVADIEPFPCHVLHHRVGAGRPIYMPDPDAVVWPAGRDERRAIALSRQIERNRRMLVSAKGKASLAALGQIRDRRSAIRAVAELPETAKIPNFGDFTRIAAQADDYPIDLLVGGTPCQAFSVAGARKGLDDARGNLTLAYVDLVHASKSLRWAVWENVPGVLSDATNAFGCFLAGLVGGDDPLRMPDGGRYPDAGMVSGPLGRAAWRVLDAQHFGLAQRRRRVFVVFCPTAAGGDPSAILFERKGMPRDFAQSGQAREGIACGAGEGAAGSDDHCHGLAPALTSSGRGVSRPGETRGQDPVVAVPAIDCTPNGIACTVSSKWHKGSGGPAGDEHYNMVVDIAPTLLAGGNGTGGTRPPGTTVDNCESLIPVEVAHTLRAEGFDASEDGTGRGTPLVPVAFDCKASGQNGFGVGEIASTLRSMGHTSSHQNGGGHAAVATASAVRRLTPTECERLQGFPDDHTLIPWKGLPAEGCPDGPRYKALGNSMAVPVMRWIGERIQAFEDGTLDDYVFAVGPFDWESDPDYFDDAEPVNFAMRGREGGAMPEVGDGKIGALRAASGGSSRDFVVQ